MNLLLRPNGLRATAPSRSPRLRSGQARLGELVVLLIWFVVFTAPGYGGAIQRSQSGLVKRWKPDAPIPYLINPGGVPGFTGELQRLVVSGAVDDAFRAWKEAPGAAIALTNAGVSSQTNTAIDGTSLVTFQDSAFQFAPGVLAVALVVSATASGPTQVGSRVINAEFEGQILDVDIAFNPRPPNNMAFSPVGANNTIDLVSVAIREAGYLLGLDHTGVLSSIMNPFSESGAGIASRTLQTDDTITIASLYPAATFAADRGTLSGTITSSKGSPVKSANVIAVSSTGGVPVASQLSDTDGRFSIAGLPPGAYQVLVEPLDGPISLGNFPGFYQDGSANFATTFLGGLSSPTTVSVAAGQTAAANVVVPARPAGILKIDQLGIRTEVAPGQFLFTFGPAPLFLPRGKSYQIFVTGSNQTSDSNLTVTGNGVTGGATTGGSLPNSQPIRQQTVTVSASAALGPSNLSLSNSSSTAFFPGGIVATVNPNMSPPLLEGAGFTSNLTPGAIFSVFGTDLALGRGAQGTESAVATPLPTSMGGVSVKVGDRLAPLLFVSPTQINGVIPFEVTGSTAQVWVVTGPNAAGNTVTVSLAPTAPGIFFVDLGGRQQGAILNGGDNTFAAPSGSLPGAHPARPGDVVVVFASGLGPVSPALPSGVAAGAGGSTIPTLTSPPRVTIGGQQATIQFAGLASGFVGLYQVNAVVPSIAANAAAPVQITTAQGQTSNTVVIAVGP